MNHQAKMNTDYAIQKFRAKEAAMCETKYRRPFPNEYIKQCACGASYTLAQWLNLPNRGRSEMPHDGDPPLMEFRDCVCGSTLGQSLDAQGHPVTEVRDGIKTLRKLGQIASQSGCVMIPASGLYRSKPVSARTLMALRGTELEILFMLGIEEMTPAEKETK